ncbi:MAG: DUF370 domain-containing protein [Clostridia bacterium]|nr:DUF370 domain-containing protein [Clostridia bacterium]
MFLHVGNQKNIRMSAVIGIFDMDNATVSSVTRKYLSGKERTDRSESAAAEELPKSFVLYREDGEYRICFSPLSVSALMGRMNGQGFAR